ncbi:hypothetical protein SQ03_06895 [Methylobacterium platani JCM 14648]|uniref:Uncharacterized protein n=2 Tax=Methylobacterium platani TaxID=427683 RepID=A0A179S1V9_9HYPH|nr:hypothetical protein SQ03_06895 [Methylobacterium platani JCM 14648]OAS19556.1 hypothetical protein A5481_24380 [Methylobacterium platani]
MTIALRSLSISGLTRCVKSHITTLPGLGGWVIGLRTSAFRRVTTDPSRAERNASAVSAAIPPLTKAVFSLGLSYCAVTFSETKQ